ncbi:YSIRK-type signal peptide-containing protein, partial [Gemella sp.]
MIGKNNQYLKDTKQGTKVESYSIKKFKVGAASVVIGASIFFGVGSVAQASEQVSNNRTSDKEENSGVKENILTEPVAVAQPVAKETIKEEVAKAVAAKVLEETPKKETAEVKTADKTALKSAIEKLEQKLTTAKAADESALKAAREELSKAKATFSKADATQEEVNTAVATLDALTTTVSESNAAGMASKEEEKKAEARTQAEKKETTEVKEAKKELTQVSSEAEVTNVLANEALRKNEVKLEAKPAVVNAVAKNEEVIKVANTLLGSENITKEQIAKSLAELSESIKAVYSELENAGVKREDKYGVALSANEGYTSNSTELRKENGEFATATGKSYKVLDGNDKYRVYVHGYQSENTDVKSSNNGRPDVGGRTDIPLSKTEAKKIADEALLWRGKVRASGRNNNNNTWGAGGPYEYLTTEIYGYTYEQGTHYVYITDVKKRFSLSKEAEAAGYSIKKIDLSNLIPGTGYNEKTDTVEGYAASNLQNGVYDMRYILTIEKGGQTQQVAFRDLTAGWIGWQDSTAPYILGTSKIVTIGDEVEHDIKYADNETMNKDERAGYTYTNDGSKVLAGSKTAPNTSKKATFTAIDGTKISTMSNPLTVNAHTTLNGVYTGKDASITDVIPGLNYNPTTGKIHGTATEAGIYTVAALGKDY